MKPTFLYGLASRSVRLSVSCIAPRRPEWARAMQNEFEYLEGNDLDALAWSLGCAKAVVVLALPQIAFAAALLGSDIAIVWLDWTSNSDIPALLGIVASTVTLAYLRPRRALTPAFAIGLAPLAAHVFANFTGWFWPSYQYAPLTLRDYAELASVAALASACAWIGAKGASLLQPNRSNV